MTVAEKGGGGPVGFITQAKITCPVCGQVQEEEMPLGG